MKKAALIFLLSVYVLSTSGLSVRAFYCCDKLKSVKLSLADHGTNNDGCCKTTYQSFKIKDTHLMADAITAPVLHYAVVHLFHSTFNTLSLSPTEATYSNSHAPPLYTGVPVYISDCVYRI